MRIWSLAFLAFLAFSTVNSLDSYRLVKTFCEIQRTERPIIYRKFRLETHCLVAVGVYQENVRHLYLLSLLSLENNHHQTGTILLI